jgi:hypothetical protein
MLLKDFKDRISQVGFGAELDMVSGVFGGRSRVRLWIFGFQTTLLGSYSSTVSVPYPFAPAPPPFPPTVRKYKLTGE